MAASTVVFAYTVPAVGVRAVAYAAPCPCARAGLDARPRDGVAGVLSRLPTRTMSGTAMAVPLPSLPCASRLLSRFSLVLTTFPPVYRTSQNSRPSVGWLWPRKK